MKAALLSALLLLAVSAGASNKYVRPSAAGSATGADWNNAWSMANLNSSFSGLSPGDNVWLAGGTYATTLSPSRSGSAGNYITVYRVRSTNAVPAAAAGWSSAFDSTVHLSGWTEDSKGFLAINGQITDGITFTLADGDIGATVNNTTGPHTFAYCTFIGPGWGAFCGYGININGSSTGDLIDHCRFDGVIQQLSTSTDGGICQYCEFRNAGPGTASCHSDMIYAGGPINWTYRYNYFSNSWSQAFFFDSGGSSGIYIYGNVADQGALGNGTWFQCKQGFTWGDFHIFNNTMIGWSTDGIQVRGTISSGNACQITNNLFWNTTWDRDSSAENVVADYNGYSGPVPATVSEPHSTGSHSGSNPFVSSANGNYQLAAASWPIGLAHPIGNVGLQTFDVDPLGVSRGSAWNIGAYEFSNGIAPSAPPLSLSGATLQLNGAMQLPQQ